MTSEQAEPVIRAQASVAQHSPAPWHVAPTYGHMANEYNQPFAIVKYETANMLAGVFGDGHYGKDAEANARLIAAAPELLEALKALQLQALQSSVNDAANEWGREALALTRAAIAKATGAA